MSALPDLKLNSVVERVLMLAKKLGATSAEASASFGNGFSVTVRMGEVETVEHHRDKGIEITTYIDHKTGTVSTSDSSEAALQLAVEKACYIAKLANEDPCAGLADKKLMAFDYPNLDLYHPWNLTTEQAIQLATQCENIARAEDKRITNSEGATVNTHDYFHFYGNTHGFRGSYPSSRHSISTSLIATSGNSMQRDYDYTEARDPYLLDDVSVVAKRAALRTVRRLGAKKISTQHCPVIFSFDTAKSLLANFINAISGGHLYRKSSFLLDHLDKQIFPDFVSIDEQPHLLKGLGSAPFDTEGVRTYKKYLVENGILKSYVLGNYSACKLGMQSTGNAGGVHNIFLKSTDQTFADLLKKMQRGLLVTELIGHGTNLVTGDYSRGAFGYWIENGEIQYPVHEITIAENLKEMFLHILAIANDIDLRGNIHTGSILIEKMTVAGA